MRAEARRFAAGDGVIGVFWGTVRPEDGAASPPGLVLHTTRRTRAMRGAAAAAGVPVAVLEVPAARQHVLDNRHAARCDDAARGRSTVTAVGLGANGPRMLLSGHGTLPLIDGELPSVYVGQVAAPARVRVASATESLNGTLAKGRLDATSDYAVADMAGPAAGVSRLHHGAERLTPVVVRRRSVIRGEVVRHFSIMVGARRAGSVSQVALDRILLPGVGGHRYPYRGIFVVSSLDSLPYSKGGDSGSLVVDAQHRAVGVVIGGDESKRITYVLPLDAALDELGAEAAPFFVKEAP